MFARYIRCLKNIQALPGRSFYVTHRQINGVKYAFLLRCLVNAGKCQIYIVGVVIFHEIYEHITIWFRTNTMYSIYWRIKMNQHNISYGINCAKTHTNVYRNGFKSRSIDYPARSYKSTYFKQQKAIRLA